MSLKLKAFIQASGIMFLALFGGIGATIILQAIPPAAYPYIVMGALLLICFNVLYSITLSQLQYKEKLKEITEKKD